LQHNHTRSDLSPPKKNPKKKKIIIIKTEKNNKKQYNVKHKKLKQYNPPPKSKQKCTPQKNHLSKKYKKNKTKPKKTQ
jgi:hypothetical protein